MKNGEPGSSLVNVEPVSVPECTTEARPRDSVDGDGDTVTVTDADTVVTEQTLVPSTQRSHCAVGDVSNLLGICGDGDDDGWPATTSNPDQLCPGPCEDTYGWEAELERKISADEQRKDTPAFRSLATSVRRSNQGARKLIHRVFSIGPSSMAGEFNPGRRASTAN